MESTESVWSYCEYEEGVRDLELVLADAVEGKVLVVGRVERPPQDACLDLVVFVGQQLQLDVRIAGADVRVAGRQPLASHHRDVQRALLNVVPAIKIIKNQINESFLYM